MSSHELQSRARGFAIGAAALLIQIGGVATAGQPDIQQQMRQVLSGHIESHLTSRAQSGSDEASRTDAQAFTRRVLQGWSAATVAGSRPAKEHHVAANSAKYLDLQAMVRRQLLGG